MTCCSPNRWGASSPTLAFFPFARRYLGNRFLFLFLSLLRCFSSRRYLLYTILFIYRWLRFTQPGFPIRISADGRLFAPSRSFSQLSTSFFGSQCQGIHLMLLLTWPYIRLQISDVRFQKNLTILNLWPDLSRAVCFRASVHYLNHTFIIFDYYFNCPTMKL